MMRQRIIFVTAWLGLSLSAAWAGGLSDLERFLSSVRSGDVGFTQTVTSAQASAKPQVLNGRMRFVRPSQFRFDYRTPYTQTIVADGQAVWLHDIDLQQVTVSDQQTVLATSPAGLLLAARDVASLRRAFELSELPDAEGLQWLSARPRQKDAAIVEAKLAFDVRGLARLEMLDAFGQRSTFHFDDEGMGKAVEASVFRFQPPASVDVIDQRISRNNQ